MPEPRVDVSGEPISLLATLQRVRVTRPGRDSGTLQPGTGPGLIYILLTHHIISTNQSPAFLQAAFLLVGQISGVNDSRMEPGVFLPAINKCDVKSNLRVSKKIITPQEVKK